MQPQPITSPDGQFVWDGTQWSPNPNAPTPPPPPAAPAAAAPAPYGGPKPGTLVGYTAKDDYSDAEVTRYGLVVNGVGADPNVPDSTDRAEIAWLPEGTALLPVGDLDQL